MVNDTRSLAAHFHPRVVCVVLAATLLSVPVIVVASFVFQPAGDVWRHLVDTVLALYVRNSALLMVGVAAGTLSIGVTSAWLTTMCRFPGRRTFEWALLLPLAMPAYIIAYTYTGMFDFAGPAQTTLRETFGWSRDDYWFPEIRSLGGVMVMLSLVFYPYWLAPRFSSNPPTPWTSAAPWAAAPGRVFSGCLCRARGRRSSRGFH
jgi:iron(III) transport system permease protein